MKIHGLEAYAQEHGFDSVKFSFVNLMGDEVKCKWLDAYMGLFSIEETEGFITVSDWIKATNDCFDFKIIENETTHSEFTTQGESN